MCLPAVSWIYFLPLYKLTLSVYLSICLSVYRSIGLYVCLSPSTYTVGAASQWWSNEGMMVYFKLMMVKCLLKMVKCSSMTVISIWSYTLFTIIDYHFTIIIKHFTIISLKYTIICSFDHHWEAAPTDT